MPKSDSVSQTCCRKFNIQKCSELFFFPVNRGKIKLHLPQEQPKICHKNYQKQALWSLHAGLCNTDLYADE